MKTACALLLLYFSIPACAMAGGMQNATVHSMHKVPCGQQMPVQPPTPGTLSGFIPGPPEDTTVGDCTEYELRTDKVTYIIRPNHSVLLLLGSDVSIKLAKNELLLRTSGGSKEIRCTVVSMTLRSDAEQKERNHTVRTCYSDSGSQAPCPAETGYTRR